MSFARVTLTHIATSTGKSPSDVESFITTLEKNWYDSPESLRSAKVEELIELGIPRFLAGKLIESAQKGQGSNISQQNTAGKNQEEGPLLPLKITDSSKTKKKEKSVFEEKVEEIDKEFLTSAEKTKSIGLIKTIVDNILKDPTSDKYRTLSGSNNMLCMTLWKFRSIRELFALIGFVFNPEANNYFLPQQTVSRLVLEELSNLFDKELVKASQDTFDPFKPSYTSNTANFSIDTLSKLADHETSKFAEELEKLKKNREQLLQNSRFEPLMKIYHRTTAPQFAEDQMETEGNENQDRAIYMRRVMEFQAQFQKEMTFQSARKREFDELVKSPLVPFTELKIQLPNNFIIQLKMHVLEKFRSVITIVASQLIIKERFFLFIVPMLKDKFWSDDQVIANKTLTELGLIPNASLTLKFHNESLNMIPNMLLNQPMMF